MGSQIDVFPTLMGILNQDFINNTLGIDLMNEDRKIRNHQQRRQNRHP